MCDSMNIDFQNVSRRPPPVFFPILAIMGTGQCLARVTVKFHTNMIKRICICSAMHGILRRGLTMCIVVTVCIITMIGVLQTAGNLEMESQYLDPFNKSSVPKVRASWPGLTGTSCIIAIWWRCHASH